MTIQGAIAELQNLLNADDVPMYYKGGIEKVIETIAMEFDKDINVRSKTEPQIKQSEEFKQFIGHDCSKCRWSKCGEACAIPCCDFEPKDEPQTNADQHVQHVGSVETMSCEECKHWIFTSQWGWFCPLKGQDECHYEPIEDEPQTDCYVSDLCKHYGDKQICGRCRSRNLFAEADTEPKPKTEPQTEDTCKGCVNETDCPWK